MNEARITRVKQFARPGGNYRFAWKWLYSVDDVCVGTSLVYARTWAKRFRPGARIVETWKQEVEE